MPTNATSSKMVSAMVLALGGMVAVFGRGLMVLDIYVYIFREDDFRVDFEVDVEVDFDQTDCWGFRCRSGDLNGEFC